MADGPLSEGSIVEVSFDDPGLRGSWYTATVIRSRSRTGRKMYVEYHQLMADDELTRPLREFVDWILVRPVPPREPPGTVQFAIDDDVDAYHDDGWWEGVITEVLEGSRYSVFFRYSRHSVFFRYSRQQLQFNSNDLRLHREWVNNDAWVPPLVDQP